MAPTSAADTKVAFGERLRRERRRQRLSQTEVATSVGTDQKVVSRAELGETTIETQLRIAKALGLELIEAAS